MTASCSNRSCVFLLRLVTAIIVLAAAHAQQITSIGACPNYQTPEFTQDYINKLVGLEDGLILAMTTGGMDACQVLDFNKRGSFTYSFVDIANYQRNYTNTYTVKPANVTTAAQIRLRVIPGILGAGLSGSLVLYPVVAQDDLLVVASCRSYGLLLLEQILVFVPKKISSSRLYTDIKATLVQQYVPHIDRLRNVSRSCTPGDRLANSPLPLRVYNIIARLTNPLGVNTRRRPTTYSVASDQQLIRHEQFFPFTENNLNLDGSVIYQPLPVVYSAAPAVFTGFHSGFIHNQPFVYNVPSAVSYDSSNAEGQVLVESRLGNNQYTKFYPNT